MHADERFQLADIALAFDELAEQDQTVLVCERLQERAAFPGGFAQGAEGVGCELGGLSLHGSITEYFVGEHYIYF